MLPLTTTYNKCVQTKRPDQSGTRKTFIMMILKGRELVFYGGVVFCVLLRMLAFKLKIINQKKIIKNSTNICMYVKKI